MSVHAPNTTVKQQSSEANELLGSQQDVPSNFDLALNGGTNQTFLNPKPVKEANVTLLDPETFRRLSISTISSLGLQSRGVSPYPQARNEPAKTFRTRCKGFWAKNQGLVLVTISQLFGALQNVITRLLELEGDGMDPFQILFVRMVLTSAFCCAWMRYQGVADFPLGGKDVRWLLNLRGFSGFFGIYGMYYSLQYLPMADAVVITFLAPSVASYACYLFLHEPFSRSAQYASLVSLLGVVLIARPTSFFSNPATADFASSETSVADSPIPTAMQRLSAVAVALIGVLGSAAAFTSIRWIGPRAHALMSVNYFAVWCTVISTLALSLSKPLHLSSTLAFALPAGLRQWSMLLFLGVCGFVMQFLLTQGLACGGKGNGARATNMIYTNMLFALALDKMVFGQSPGWWSLAGSGLILGSAVVVAVQQQGTGAEREVDEEMAAARGADAEEASAMLDEQGRGRATAAEVGEELTELSAR